MAHRGPAARASKLGTTPNAEWTDVVDEPYDGDSPDLPKLRGRKWNDLVAAWWTAVRRMPHCVLWREADWLFAIETALMKQEYWLSYTAGESKTTAAMEIRRREDQMGCTAEARRKLRIRYVEPPEEEQVWGADPNDGPPVVVEEEDTVVEPDTIGSVTPLSSRRARLTA